jgi:hypothetical protein
LKIRNFATCASFATNLQLICNLDTSPRSFIRHTIAIKRNDFTLEKSSAHTCGYVAVDDDTEGEKGNGGRIQKSPETLGQDPAESGEGQVRVPQQLQNGTHGCQHGEERLRRQFALPGSGIARFYQLRTLATATSLLSTLSRHIFDSLIAYGIELN